MSDSKRVRNDIGECETLCDHQISPDAHFVVRVQIAEFGSLDEDAKVELAKKLLSPPQKNGAFFPVSAKALPSVAFKTTDSIFLLFEPSESVLFKGSQQKICSYYASFIGLELGLESQITIVEFVSQAKVIVFFQIKVQDVMKDSIVGITVKSKTKNTIKRKDLESLTFSEIKDLLRQTTGTNWDEMPKAERFGTFYRKIGGKYATMSEPIDLRDIEKYRGYFFSR